MCHLTISGHQSKALSTRVSLHAKYKNSLQNVLAGTVLRLTVATVWSPMGAATRDGRLHFTIQFIDLEMLTRTPEGFEH